MSIPAPLPDKPGQGALWEQVRVLSNDYLDASNKGDTEGAGRIERRLASARATFHRLHGKKVQPCTD